MQKRSNYWGLIVLAKNEVSKSVHFIMTFHIYTMALTEKQLKEFNTEGCSESNAISI